MVMSRLCLNGAVVDGGGLFGCLLSLRLVDVVVVEDLGVPARVCQQAICSTGRISGVRLTS